MIRPKADHDHDHDHDHDRVKSALPVTPWGDPQTLPLLARYFLEVSDEHDPTPLKGLDALDALDASRPHDALFKFTFSKPRHAEAELRALLPAEVVALVEALTATATNRVRLCAL